MVPAPARVETVDTTHRRNAQLLLQRDLVGHVEVRSARELSRVAPRLELGRNRLAYAFFEQGSIDPGIVHAQPGAGHPGEGLRCREVDLGVVAPIESHRGPFDTASDDSHQKRSQQESSHRPSPLTDPMRGH